MKIAYLVTRSDTIGGSHIHVRDIAVAMQKNGHQAFVLIGGNGPIIRHFQDFGIDPVVIPDLKRNISPFSDVKAYLRIKEVLKNLQPDIVSTHSSKAGFLGRLAAHKLKYPVIFTAHGWSFTTGKPGLKSKLYRQLEKWVAPLTDKVITVSDYDKELAIQQLSLDEKKIVTIHNGMPEPKIGYEVKANQSDCVKIVMIARFDKQKDHFELLEAIDKNDNIHLQFVGDGPYMNAVKEKAQILGLTEKITFWGRLDSVDEVLAKSDLFTLISNWEGFPRSTLEAMGAGLPAIVSNVGGAAEAIEEGVTGFVVEKGDVETLRARIKLLVQNSELRNEMGLAARKRFEKYYTFNIMFEKTKTVYAELLNSKKTVV